MSDAVLVTGGAGYIGSHVVRQLGQSGRKVVVLDNLSKGFRDSVLYGELVVGDTSDAELVSRVLAEHKIRSVMHFAAHTVVPESVTNPMKYYGNNTCASRNLLQCCQQAGVQHFIFSSTAAVYGVPDVEKVDENVALAPINAYGTSKLMTEWMLRDLGVASDLRHVVLRYFNVAGCDPEGRIGQRTPDATLLIKVAAEVAVGKRPSISIFGTDFDTPDGSGVRDYIHVEDLADAHLKALAYLEKGGDSATLNCGYGHGYSVREVLDAVQRNNPEPITIKEEGRRAGDPPSLIADSSRIQALLGWQPKYDDLDLIVRTALEWERKLLAEQA